MVLQNRTGPSARIGALSKASCSHFALEDSTEAPRPYLVVLAVVASKLTNFLKENDEKLTLVLWSGPAELWQLAAALWPRGHNKRTLRAR